jgi:hypothetical protein
MSTFHVVQFDVLTLQTVLAECRRLNWHDVHSVAVAFTHWQREFARKAILFYHAQYAQHYNHLWENFCRDYGLTLGDTIPEWLDFAWQARREDEDLDGHAHFVESQRVMLDEYAQHEVSASIAEAKRCNPIDFDALWFNTVAIRNTPERQEALRALPYDAYLATRHWRRVRAAMLLLNQGVCQNENCKSVGESWFGDETMVQVHHLRYDNIGGERYCDLRLLCKDCHQVAHYK